MDKIMQTNTHAPCGYMGMLGCSGYGNTSNVICMTASGDNHFLNFGIVEGSLLFVDTGKAYTKGVLNVFKYSADQTPRYRLSTRKVRGATYVGNVLMAVNQF